MGIRQSLLSESLDLVQDRSFACFIASRFASGAAMMLLRSTIIWQVAMKSGHSYYMLCFLGLAFFAPTLFLNPYTGAFADTHDRRKIMLLAQGAVLILSAILCVLSFTGSIGFAGLYLMAVLVAACGSFENPARVAFLQQLVPREKFATAVQFHTVVQLLAFLTGPVLTGYAIEFGQVQMAYGTHVVMMLASIWLLIFVVPLHSQGEPRGTSLAAIREGLAFIWQQKLVLACMSLDMFAVIFGSATALLPVFATEVLERSAKDYGFLSGSLELGAALVSLLLLFLPSIRRAGRALLIAVICYGLFTTLFGLSRLYPLSCLLYMMVGMADSVSVVTRSTTIQLSTPDHLRGRVSAVNMMFIGASNQLGLVQAGFMAWILGSPSGAVIIGGGLSVVTALLVAVLLPQLWRYERGKATQF